MLSGPVLNRQDRVKHVMKLSEGLLLMELPKGGIVHGVIGDELGLNSDIATGNQPMLVAATANDQVALEQILH